MIYSIHLANGWVIQEEDIPGNVFNSNLHSFFAHSKVCTIYMPYKTAVAASLFLLSKTPVKFSGLNNSQFWDVLTKFEESF